MKTVALAAVLLVVGVTAHVATGAPGALPDITARVVYSGTAKQVETRPLDTQDPSKVNVITTTITWNLTWTGPLGRLTTSPRFTTQSVVRQPDQQGAGAEREPELFLQAARRTRQHRPRLAPR